MQYDESFSNHEEMAELMEQAQFALSEDKFSDSLALLNEVATKATDAEDKMFGAGIAVMIYFNDILKGGEPKIGTPLYDEIYKHLKIALEGYDNSHPLAQEEFRKNSNVDQFRIYFTKMENEITTSQKNTMNQSSNNSSRILLSRNNQVFGPFEELAVNQWLNNGECSPVDLACREGTNDWKPLEMILTVNKTAVEISEISDNKGNDFKTRMVNILNIMKNNGSSIKDFQVEDKSSFEIKTHYSEYDHRTWLKYELTEDGEIVRMQLTHLLGNLDIEAGLNPEQVLKIINQLIDLFKENIPQFRGSSAFLGVKYRDGVYFVFLNAAPIFLTKWSDDDIALALKIQFLDLETSLMFVPPEPIKQFGVDEE